MFSWFVVTIWFEFDGRLAMEHFMNYRATVCKEAVRIVIDKARKKYPEQNIKAAKCNDPIIWFKKYKLNKWDQVVDKE